MSGLDLVSVSANLHRRAIPWDLHFTATCDSTQDLARDALIGGAGAGFVAATDFQALGRGRRGRTWSAPPARALLFSAVLPLPGGAASLTPLLAGLALVQGIEDATSIVADLKWPNDLLAGGRKLAGILSERPPGPLVIVGVGVNVNQSAGELPQDVAATSLAIELGHTVRREPVLVAVLNAFDDHWERAAKEGAGWIVSTWRHRSQMLGRPVTFVLDGVQQDGVAEDVNADGALVIRSADGRLMSVAAGDVREVRTPDAQL